MSKFDRDCYVVIFCFVIMLGLGIIISLGYNDPYAWLGYLFIAVGVIGSLIII